MPADRRSTLVLAGVLVASWASAFAAIRSALEDYSAVELTVARMVVASLTFVVLAPFLGIRFPPRGDWLRLVACGLFGMAAYHLLLNLGEEQVTAATAAVIIGTVPVFTTLLAMARLGETVTARRWTGIGVALVGMSVVTLEGGDGVQFEPAALLVLGAAMSAAAYTITQKPLLVTLRPVDATAWATWLGTVLLLPLAGGLPAAVADAPVGADLAVVWLGVVPSALGYAAYAAVLARLDASAASALVYLIPPVAALIAWVWLGETVGVATLVGGAVTLGGVALATRPVRAGPRAAGRRGSRPAPAAP